MSPQKSERPQWCLDCNCPIYPGNGPCKLKEKIIASYERPAARKKQYDRLEALDPAEVIRQCMEFEFPY